MSLQIEKLSAPGLVIPEPEHNSFENIHYENQHVLSWVLSALGSATRVLSGTINAGQIQGLKVLFNLSDGTREVVSFPDTDISVGDNRKIYYADYMTETILSVELPGFEDFTPDEEEFPIVHAVRYQDTPVATADKLEWIAPRTDMYAHVPVGKIIALHPYAPAPDSYFFKACDGTGTLGENFPGHETDLVPNLTDNRFLMGGTGYGTGGSNVLLDHTHTCGTESATHTHSGTTGNPSANHSHSANPPNTNSGNNSASHSHALSYMAAYDSDNNTNASYVSPGSSTNRGTGSISTGGNSANHYHATNIGAFNTGTVSAWHTHTITTGSESTTHSHTIGTGSAPTSTSSLPQYFTSIFYIKRY